MSVEPEESADAVRNEVQRLWSEGDPVAAFHRAMKSYLKAQRRFGRAARRTARFMLIVGDASRNRQKYHWHPVVSKGSPYTRKGLWSIAS